MVRRTLDFLYFAGGVLAALFIVLIGLLICAQVIGRELGIQVKGADDLTAWSVVATGFLPLAYTYRHGSHIRVTVVIHLFDGMARRLMELGVMAVALYFIGFLTYSAFDMAWDSLRFEELSQGLIVIPIWIPQISIGLGSLLLTIAVLDDVIASLRGRTPPYMVESESLGGPVENLD